MKTELFFIRHGEPELKHALLGHTDSPLSKLGWQQLETTSAELAELDVIIASPLLRCSEYAKKFSQQHNISLTLDSSWQECYFGDWDGLTYEDLYAKFPKQSDAFFLKPNDSKPPNGESLSVFYNRVLSALKEIIKTNKGKRIAIFTHAGVIRNLVAWCIGMDYKLGHQFHRFTLDYASITHISISHIASKNDPNQYFPQLIQLNKLLD